MNNDMEVESRAIVAFLDILGYKQLVENYKNNREAILVLRDLMVRASHGNVKTISEMIVDTSVLSDEEATEEERNIITEFNNFYYNSIRVRVISDTIIVVLPFSIFYKNWKDASKEEILAHSIKMLLNHVSWIFWYFTAISGFLIRGGICKGYHYEDDLNKPGNLFVFSEALVKAYFLESQTAKNPRVIIEESIYEDLTPIGEEKIDKLMFRDSDGHFCVNIYDSMIAAKDPFVLGEIKKKVDIRIKELLSAYKKAVFASSELSKRLSYYNYFCHFHNSIVLKHFPGNKNLLFNPIDVSTI